MERARHEFGNADRIADHGRPAGAVDHVHHSADDARLAGACTTAGRAGPHAATDAGDGGVADRRADPRDVRRLHAGAQLARPGCGGRSGLPEQGGADPLRGGNLGGAQRRRPDLDSAGVDYGHPHRARHGRQRRSCGAGFAAGAGRSRRRERARRDPGDPVAVAFGHRDRSRLSRQRPQRVRPMATGEHPMSGAEQRRDKAMLVLEDDRTFTGTAFGAIGQTLGEAVFSTGMSGYQETLTDPSYHRQIVVATAPQIGNTGWNGDDAESRGDKIWVAGYAVRDPSPRASNWRATGTLQDELARQHIVGIADIDTRALVRHLRSRGSMKAGVFSGAALADAPEMVARGRDQQPMLGADLAGQVSTAGEYVVEPQGPHRFSV